MTDVQRPDPTTDTTATPIPTTPLATTGGAPGAASPRRSRVRWLAAGVIVALIVGVSALATLSLTGSSPASTVVGYVPADSVAYGELRLDLPGDQRQEVGEFLSKFPGFADQAALETKLDELLDRLLSESTDGKQTYTADIKPWFDGELAFSMGPLPSDLAAVADPETATTKGRALVLLSIKDEALAQTWFTDVLTETGVTTTQETYEGTKLTVFTDVQIAAAQAAFALVDGKVAIVGDIDSVKAAIDTNGSSPLATSDAFEAASTSMAGDSLGFMFVDLRTVLDAALALTESAASAPPINDAMVGLVPEWAAFRLRVEGDALEMDSAMPHVEAAPGPSENHANGVAAFAPPSTLALAAGNDVGATLLETMDIYRQDPAMAEALEGVEQAAGILGGLEASVGWMGDTGILIAPSGSLVEGGIVSIPADAAAARQLLTTLRGFATLAGSQYGVSVRDEDYSGTTITIIDLGTAEDLAGLAGLLGGMPLPDDITSDLPADRIEISYAATDGVVVIGSSPEFVRHVLDAGAGRSLADEARYSAIVDRVGAEHTSVSFVDLAAVRALLEVHIADETPAERAEYEESIKPFLTPFDAFAAASVAGGDTDQQHAVITVK